MLERKTNTRATLDIPSKAAITALEIPVIKNPNTQLASNRTRCAISIFKTFGLSSLLSRLTLLPQKLQAIDYGSNIKILGEKRLLLKSLSALDKEGKPEGHMLLNFPESGLSSDRQQSFDLAFDLVFYPWEKSEIKKYAQLGCYSKAYGPSQEYPGAAAILRFVIDQNCLTIDTIQGCLSPERINQFGTMFEKKKLNSLQLSRKSWMRHLVKSMLAIAESRGAQTIKFTRCPYMHRNQILKEMITKEGVTYGFRFINPEEKNGMRKQFSISKETQPS